MDAYRTALSQSPELTKKVSIVPCNAFRILADCLTSATSSRGAQRDREPNMPMTRTTSKNPSDELHFTRRKRRHNASACRFIEMSVSPVSSSMSFRSSSPGTVSRLIKSRFCIREFSSNG